MVRRPAVAGSFYPAEPEELRREIDGLLRGLAPAREPRAVALMVPHAGYVYSGRVAAQTFAAVPLPRRFVLLGPNHTGLGQPIAVMDEGSWSLPLGGVEIDGPLASAILSACPGARRDESAHRREHSLEVQLPFLQRLVGHLSFVPICVGTLELTALQDLGRGVAEAIRSVGEPALIVISSDMSHYLPAAVAERLDRKALERVLAIDPGGLHRVVLQEEITMCGIAPAVAGLEAARRLGASSARLIAYSHSGEQSGDYDSVVGYAGVAVT